jgi:hypothetical protein
MSGRGKPDFKMHMRQAHSAGVLAAKKCRRACSAAGLPAGIQVFCFDPPVFGRKFTLPLQVGESEL